MAFQQLGALFDHLYRLRWSVSILLVFLLDFCTYMAFRDAGSVMTIPYEDKINHLLAFFTLFTVGHVSLQFDILGRRAMRRWVLIVQMLFWLGYGGFIELGQRFLSTRDASWLDLTFDAMGILLGYLFVITIDLFPRSAAHG